MVQLKDNLIPARVLQLEISRVKTTSCVQYLNGRLLHLCLHQGNRQAYVPTNVPLILNKLFMKLNINCIYMMNLQPLSLYVPIDP